MTAPSDRDDSVELSRPAGRDEELEQLRRENERLRREKVEIAAALRESEDKYRTVLASMDEGFCIIEVIFDEAGRAVDYVFLEINGAFERQTGMRDAVGKRVREIVPNHDEHWFRIYGDVVKTGEPIRFQEYAKGLKRWFDVYALRLGPVEQAHVAIVFIDDTDRKRAHEALLASEDALRESQERLRLIIENVREYAIIATDLHRRVTYWNPGAERLLGYADEEILGQPADLIFTPEDRVREIPLREAMTAIREGRAADERWHIRKDGVRFFGSGVMMSMHDPAGEVVGLVKIFRDQTDAMQAREKLEQSQSDLRKTVEELEKARVLAESARLAKDHFFAVLSHELRTPLTPVLMAANTLSRMKNLPPIVHESLDMIIRNVKLEAGFIDDLLDLTRIERGKMERHDQPLDLFEVIRRSVEVSQADFQEKSQRLTVTLGSGSCEMVGDEVRLQQVFWNLLKNASKFTPPSGSIALRAGVENGRVRVTIKDSGIGFSPDAAERIFDPFSQADQQVTRKYGGLGLGLAIAKATVEAHGGAIRAESAGPNQGAMMTVELPLTPPPAAMAE